MVADHKPLPAAALEITVISANGLKKSSVSSCCFPFSRRRLRPYATLRTSQSGGAFQGEYRTTAADRERDNPTWNQKFRLPMGPDLYSSSSVYLHVYAERSSGAGDRRQLGWCQIPAEDIRSPVAGLVRHLSYRLRDRDGTRGGGIVNVAVKVEGRVGSGATRPDRPDTWRPGIGMAIGLPVTGPGRIK